MSLETPTIIHTVETDLSRAIEIAHDSGMRVVVERGCGSQATWLRDCALQDPNTFFVGVDPQLGENPVTLSVQDSFATPPLANLFLYRGYFAPAMRSFTERGLVDQVISIAPFFKGIFSFEDTERLRKTDDLLDIDLVQRILTGSYRIFTYAPEWALLFYEYLTRSFPHISTAIYASVDHQTVEKNGRQHLRIASATLNGCGVYEFFDWPLRPSPTVPQQGQWGSLIGVYGLEHDQMETPLYEPHRAPPSSSFHSENPVFEITGSFLNGKPTTPRPFHNDKRQSHISQGLSGR